MWHGYFGAENLALNSAQRALLVNALKQHGDNAALQPAHRNHWRVRLDGEAVIFEARWNTSNLTVAVFKNKLGNIFSVDPATIDHAITTPNSNTVAVFSRNGTDYLRVAFFGGVSSDWETSRLATLAYIAANKADWEPATE